MRSTFRPLACALPLFLAALSMPGPVLAAPGGRSLELNEQGVKLVNKKEYAKAEDTFKQALGADPGNVTAAFNLSGMYIQNKKGREAIELLEHYAKEFPQDPGVLARLGDAYFSSKDVRKASKSYEDAYKKAPTYPGLAAKLATIYTLRKDLPKAEQMLLAAVQLDPKNGQLLTNLSSVFLANEKPQDAIATAKRALHVTSSSDVYVTLGNAYQMLNDNKNALIAFERARDLGDKRAELDKEIQSLKSVVRG